MKTKNNTIILFIVISSLLLTISGTFILINNSLAPTFAGNMYLSAEVIAGKGSFYVYYHDGDYSENNTLIATDSSGAQVDKDVDPGGSADTVYVKCTAYPATGYHLNYIYVEGKINSTTTNPYEFSDYIEHWWDFSTKHRVCEASFSINTYQVSFNGNGNTSGSMSNQSFTYNEAQNLKANGYSKIGYTFDGWSTSPSGNVVYTNGQSVNNLTAANNGIVTLYAKWDANPYTLTMDANGGSISSNGNWNGSGNTATKPVDYDDSYGTLPTSEHMNKTGYSFAGWWTAPSGGSQVSTTTKMDSISGKRIYAHWNANSFTLTMNANGGSISSSSNWNGSGSTATKGVKFDGEYGILPNSSQMSKTGYSFDDWWTSSSGGNRVTSSTIMDSTSGKEIYAHWKPNIYKIILDKAGGGGGTNEIYLKYNTSWCSNIEGTAIITSITNPTRTGYTFGGYFTSPNGGGTQIVNASGTIIGSKTYIASSDTLYAKWIANTYTIEFNSNGGSGSKDNMTNISYDTDVKLKANTTITRFGYYFLGWSTSQLEVQNTIPTNIYKDEASVRNLTSTQGGSVTLYAVWLDTWANHGIKPESGSGTKEAPYNIDSAQNLAWMINNHNINNASHYFRQIGVIDLKEFDINGQKVQMYWYPIGSDTIPFMGNFNGQGHEIKNLNIPEITNADGGKIQSNVGMFGVAESATITSVMLADATVYGKDNVGLLVSSATSSNINSNIIKNSKIYASGNSGAIAGNVSGGQVKYNLVYLTGNSGTSTKGLYTGSSTFETNLIDINGNRSYDNLNDLSGWGIVYGHLLPAGISWGAQASPAKEADIANWIDKTLN